MEDKKIIAAEKHHWYKRDGTPCYEVPYAKSNKEKAGQMRATNKRDARKLDLVPSVTSITKQLYKENLERWKQNQILESAYTCPVSRIGIDGKEWIKRVYEDSKDQAIVAAAKGTAIHADIEKFFKGEQINPENEKRCLNVLDIVKAFGCDTTDIQPEKAFSTDLYGGFGGKMDLPAIEKNIIFDIKTTEFEMVVDKKDKTVPSKQLHWNDHILQLAGYSLGNGLIEPKLINIYVSTLDDSVVFHKWEHDISCDSALIFQKLVEIWWLQF